MKFARPGGGSGFQLIPYTGRLQVHSGDPAMCLQYLHGPSELYLLNLPYWQYKCKLDGLQAPTNCSKFVKDTNLWDNSGLDTRMFAG